MHISSEEQLRRFERRAKDPLKQWKLTEDDWRNRERRPQYEEAVEDMLARNDQPNARWNLIEADSKRYARVRVIETVIERMEEGMRAVGMEPPPADTGGRLIDEG
jgi:AMP-polyphosphate phosphotransferase